MDMREDNKKVDQTAAFNVHFPIRDQPYEC